METFQISTRPDDIWFANKERIEETLLFQQVYEKLRSNPRIQIGDKQVGPSEDFYFCKIDGHPFVLFHDLEEGPFIHVENDEAKQKILDCIS